MTTEVEAVELTAVDALLRSSQSLVPSPVPHAKLAVPQRPPFLVRRQRLLDRMVAGSAARVTVVTGPAGSGKTQLVASWVVDEAATGSVAWVTLDEDDTESSAFWSYVVEALRGAGVVLDPDTVQHALEGTVDRAFLTHLATDLAAHSRRVSLVLDGSTFPSETQWGTELDFVLRYADSRLRLIAAGRWDPPVPLHGYRLAGDINEVRADELTFTRAEATELFAVHGITLDTPILDKLLRYTEGWAAGLRLLAMTIEGRADADRVLATITEGEGLIADYLVDEVLRRQTSEVRDFLLKTSILDTFTPGLAEIVTGHSGARRTIEALERGNAFVQHVAGRAATYRYHGLFRDILQAQLSNSRPSRLIAHLHRRAAGWLAAEGRFAEAIEHAATAQDWCIAAEIAVQNYAWGRVALYGVDDRLGALFAAMPDEAESADTAVIGAALAIARRDVDHCAELLAYAGELRDDAGRRPEDPLALAIAVVEVLLADVRDPAEVLAAVPAAVHCLAQAPAEEIARHPELNALIVAAQGSAQSKVGDLDGAIESFESLTRVTAAVGVDCEVPVIRSLQHLALIEAYRGRLRHAVVLANRAIDEDQRNPTSSPGVALAELVLAWVAAEQYDVQSAWRHLRTAESTVQGTRTTAAVAAAVVRARLLCTRGDLRGALQALEADDGDEAAWSGPTWLVQEIAVSRTRVLIAAGTPDAALAIARPLAASGAARARVALATALMETGDLESARRIAAEVVETAGLPAPLLIDAWLVLAAVAVGDEDPHHARTALSQAVRLATPELLRRPFNAVGTRLRRLLRDDRELAARYQALSGQTKHLHSPATDPHSADTALVVEPLSKRELEVLRELANFTPTEEIAAKLYVSVNTIKTHIRSILRKLSAARRGEAVRRAQSLGLL